MDAHELFYDDSFEEYKDESIAYTLEHEIVSKIKRHLSRIFEQDTDVIEKVNSALQKFRDAHKIQEFILEPDMGFDNMHIFNIYIKPIKPLHTICINFTIATDHP